MLFHGSLCAREYQNQITSPFDDVYSKNREQHIFGILKYWTLKLSSPNVES